MEEDSQTKISVSEVFSSRELVLAIIVFTLGPVMCITYMMCRPLEPVAVKYVASTGYTAETGGRFSSIQSLYVHYYEGTVNGERIIFENPNQRKQKGYDRTILVNPENPKDYEMYSSKFYMLLYLLCLNIPIFITIGFCVYLLIILKKYKDS